MLPKDGWAGRLWQIIHTKGQLWIRQVNTNMVQFASAVYGYPDIELAGPCIVFTASIILIKRSPTCDERYEKFPPVPQQHADASSIHREKIAWNHGPGMNKMGSGIPCEVIPNAEKVPRSKPVCLIGQRSLSTHSLGPQRRNQGREWNHGGVKHYREM